MYKFINTDLRERILDTCVVITAENHGLSEKMMGCGCARAYTNKTSFCLHVGSHYMGHPGWTPLCGTSWADTNLANKGMIHCGLHHDEACWGSPFCMLWENSFNPRHVIGSWLSIPVIAQCSCPFYIWIQHTYKIWLLQQWSSICIYPLSK